MNLSFTINYKLFFCFKINSHPILFYYTLSRQECCIPASLHGQALVRTMSTLAKLGRKTDKLPHFQVNICWPTLLLYIRYDHLQITIRVLDIIKNNVLTIILTDILLVETKGDWILMVRQIIEWFALRYTASKILKENFINMVFWRCRQEFWSFGVDEPGY